MLTYTYIAIQIYNHTTFLTEAFIFIQQVSKDSVDVS